MCRELPGTQERKPKYREGKGLDQGLMAAQGQKPGSRARRAGRAPVTRLGLHRHLQGCFSGLISCRIRPRSAWPAPATGMTHRCPSPRTPTSRFCTRASSASSLSSASPAVQRPLLLRSQLSVTSLGSLPCPWDEWVALPGALPSPPHTSAGWLLPPLTPAPRHAGPDPERPSVSPSKRRETRCPCGPAPACLSVPPSPPSQPPTVLQPRPLSVP